MLTLFWFLVALGVLVTFHEFGHYYVARLAGVKVLRFSVGFGKPLYSWKDKRGTEFSLSAIPLGGYVKMLDEREGPVDEAERPQAFTQKNVWARIAIVSAGPLANFLLAIFLFWVTFLPPDTTVAPVVGSVIEDSVAEKAGLEPGVEIIAIDGSATPSWTAVNQALLKRLGESGNLSLTVQYPESDLQYESNVYLNEWLKGDDSPNALQGLGIEVFRPDAEPVVGTIGEGTPAQTAGLELGDEFIAIDGQVLESWQALVDKVRPSPGQPLVFTVLRDGKTLDLTITPAAVDDNGETIGQIGVAPVQPWPESMLRHYNRSVPEAFVAALQESWDTSIFVFVSIKKLIVGEISTKNLSGPFTIAKVAGDSAEAGWIVFLSVLAMLSINLGVLNLLPIPVLDGGHLLFYLVEAVKGSPVSERIQLIGYQVGLFLVAGIMILAFYNDIVRIFQGQLFG